MAHNVGPYGLMPGTPWFGVAPAHSRGGGSLQPAPNLVVSQKVIVKSKSSVNPGVLASGRRQDRPGR